MKRNTMKLVVALVCAFGLLAGIAPGDAPSQAWAKKKHPAHSKFEDSTLIPVGDSPTLGNPNAPVTIVMFLGFLSRPSYGGFERLKALQKNHPQGIRLVFKHFATRIRAGSEDAQRASLAAREQGKFWEMADILFKNQDKVREASQKRVKELTSNLAKPLGINTKTFEKDFSNVEYKSVIHRDTVLGQKLCGDAAFSCVLINGEDVGVSSPMQKLESTYQKHLSKAKAARGTKTYASSVDENYKWRTRHTARPRPSMFQLVPVIQGRDSIAGDTDQALVTLVTFHDLLCPFSSRMAQTIDKLREIYGSKVRVVFKHKPAHTIVALAALSAKRQGRIQDYQAMVVERRDKIRTNTKFLYDIANELKLDMKLFKQGIEDPALMRQVEDDQALAEQTGAWDTPSFFINGRLVTGARSLEGLQKIVDKELRQAKVIQAKYKVRGEELYLEAVNENIRQHAKQNKGARQ